MQPETKDNNEICLSHGNANLGLGILSRPASNSSQFCGGDLLLFGGFTASPIATAISVHEEGSIGWVRYVSRQATA